MREDKVTRVVGGAEYFGAVGAFGCVSKRQYGALR